MDSNGQRRIVNMLKRIGKLNKEKYMEMNTSNGTVDYLSPPKAGKDQWFMPVVLDNGTKIKFYCKFDPETSVGAKVRVHYDLTRDQLALKPPAEVQTMINDPKLVELAYSQTRVYQSQELRQLMVAIRKWGKPN